MNENIKKKRNRRGLTYNGRFRKFMGMFVTIFKTFS